MQTLSLIWGILAMIGMLIAFFPCLGALNWLNIPFSGVGIIISVLAMAGAPPGRQGNAKTGLVLCIIATVLGVIRLTLGAGIF